MRVSAVLAVIACLCTTVTQAGFFFKELKPAAFKPQEKMNVYVGELASEQTMRTMYFYDLNYCHGSVEHRYEEERAKELAKSMYGGSFDSAYERNTYESFLRYYAGQNRTNEQACQRQLTGDQYDAF